MTLLTVPIPIITIKIKHICKPVFAGTTTAAATRDEHSGHRGRHRLCDRRLGGRKPQRPRAPAAAVAVIVAGDGGFVRHRPVHRRGPRDHCERGRRRFLERRVRRGARLPSARRTVGLRTAVRRRGHVQQAVRSVVRRRQPGVPHPSVLGTAVRRRRDRPDQRPTGEQTEP